MANASRVYSAIDDFESQFVKPREGLTLIVGSRVYNDKPDRRNRYAEAIGVDMLDGDGVDRVIDMEQSTAHLQLPLVEHVECCSVLEHSRAPWAIARNIEAVLKPGGTLFVTVPWVFRTHGYPSDYWRISAEAIPLLFSGVEWQTIRYVSQSIIDGSKLPVVKHGGYPYIARTETCAFGVRT